MKNNRNRNKMKRGGRGKQRKGKMPETTKNFSAKYEICLLELWMYEKYLINNKNRIKKKQNNRIWRAGDEEK